MNLINFLLYSSFLILLADIHKHINIYIFFCSLKNTNNTATKTITTDQTAKEEKEIPFFF